ncbi:MAG: hypothetical protein KME59_21400 [Trichormus sp. ATA11-4-KO1]|jgi:hypothetical protein|nr:hypothetical protein [Trichormus sp. ATA11-4-KO1]
MRQITLEVAESLDSTDTTSIIIDQFDIIGVTEQETYITLNTRAGSFNLFMEDQPIETENAINQFIDPM